MATLQKYTLQSQAGKKICRMRLCVYKRYLDIADDSGDISITEEECNKIYSSDRPAQSARLNTVSSYSS